MKQAIKVTKLMFSYDDIMIIKEINFQVSKGSITTIIGNTGGGKSTLVKLLTGTLTGTGNIEIFGKNVENLLQKDFKDICVIEMDDYKQFKHGSVLQNLMSVIDKNIKQEQREDEINYIAKLFKIDKILSSPMDSLTKEELVIVTFAINFLKHPKLVILDDAFVHVGMLKKKQLLKTLKRLNRERHITILNVTHDINEILYGSYAILLYQGKVVLKGDVNDFVKCEKLLKKYHYELPFLAELSNKLSYYNVIDTPILDMNRMVNAIWK